MLSQLASVWSRSVKSASPLSPALTLSENSMKKSRLKLVPTTLLAILLGACGSDNATDRISKDSLNPGATTGKTATLTMRSPYLVQNVTFKVYDALTGTEIDSKDLSSGNDVELTIGSTYLNVNRPLIVTLAATPGKSATYFDYALNKIAPLTETLHAAIPGVTQNMMFKIDAYSEITYQRAMIRSDNLELSPAKWKLLNEGELSSAGNEMMSVLRVRPLDTKNIVNNDSDFASLKFTDNYLSYTDFLFSASNAILQYQENPSETTPYMTFMKRAAEDMHDGDMDGLTLIGLGNVSGDPDRIRLNNPLVQPSVINVDPDNNKIQGILQLQAATQKNFGDRLRVAAMTYLQRVSSHYSMSPDAVQFIQSYDYVAANNHPLFKLHSAGAGNYTRAFGLSSLPSDGTALLAYHINTDDVLGTNALEQINGRYTSGNCQLTIYPSGAIELRSGTAIYNALVNREKADSISRTSVTSDLYLINISNQNTNPPQFIQIRTKGAKVLSATAGVSTQEVPQTLDRTDLSCAF